MKNRKLLLIVSLVLAMTMSLGGTLAYLTDTDGEVNVMTVGNVIIDLIEQQRNEERTALEDYEQGKTLLPLVGSAQGDKDEFGMPKAANYHDKIISVKNTGRSDAWVRVLVAVPTTLMPNTGDNTTDNPLHTNLGNRVDFTGESTYNTGDSWKNTWKWTYNTPTAQIIKIGGVDYTVECFYYTEKLAAGEQTSAAIAGVYLDSRVDYDVDNGYYTFNKAKIDNFNGTVVIPVLAQAVQADGFDTYEAAFNAAFPYTSTEVGAETNGELQSWFNGMLNVAPVAPQPDEENPNVYEISNAAELFGFAEMVNDGTESFKGKTVVLTADINLANQPWTPIGQTGNAVGDFLGVFDGQGHTISNLYVENVNETNEFYASGLFGWLFNANVKNVNINGAKVAGNAYVGVIAGYLEWESAITNCNVVGATVIGKHVDDTNCGDKVGVIVGFAGNAGTKVETCTAKNCSVVAGRDAGQIAGAAKQENIVNCTATNVSVTAGGDCPDEANINEAVIGRVL